MDVELTQGPEPAITMDKVSKAINRMKNGKAAGPSVTTIDITNGFGEDAEEWLIVNYYRKCGKKRECKKTST